uniref:Kinesin-like protein KIF14 n=1 Tax=Lygus hesperus TaxID=30085 RepID=A0A0A9WNQ1_LYGHE
MLSEYFGGNSKSTMIVTISPTKSDAHITEQTLKTADNAKRVTNCAKINFIETKSCIPEGNAWPEELQKEYDEKRAALYEIYNHTFHIEKNESMILKLKLTECLGEASDQTSVNRDEIDELVAINE